MKWQREQEKGFTRNLPESSGKFAVVTSFFLLLFFFFSFSLTVPSEGQVQHNANKTGSYIALPTATSQRMRGVWCEEQQITLTWLQGHDRRS